MDEQAVPEGVGDRDVYEILDLPDNESAAAVAIAASAAGGRP